MSVRRPKMPAAYALTASIAFGFSTIPVHAHDDNHGAEVSAVATDKDDNSGTNHGAAVSAAARHNHGHRDGEGSHAAMATFAGLVPAAGNVTTYLRITNFSDAAGTSTVTLRTAATGAQLGTWTSASLPGHASVQVDLADIAANATPALSAADAGAAADLSVAATFNGAVQAVQWNTSAGSLTNLTPCVGRKANVIPYIEGTVANVSGGLRLVNRTTASRHAVITLSSAVDGTTLGTWTSPDVPAGGSLTISAASIAAAATPVVAPGPAYTLAAQPDDGLSMQHVVVSGPNAVTTDMSNLCRMRPIDNHD